MGKFEKATLPVYLSNLTSEFILIFFKDIARGMELGGIGAEKSRFKL